MDLVPADWEANPPYTQRDRLPASARLLAARGTFQETHRLYLSALVTSRLLRANRSLGFRVKDTRYDALRGDWHGRALG
jgi:hypothetical protein